MKDSISPFINKRILVLNQDTPAKVAARALHERHFGSAVVSDRHGHLVGLVTDRDLSSGVLGFGLPPTTPISEIMTTDILSVGKSATLADAIKIMEINGIRRIPVIEKTPTGREKCIGMVTLDDLLASESINSTQTSRIIKSQILRRQRGIRHPYKDEGHREQTLNRFNKVMAGKMNLPRATSERLTFHILRTLVQRLPYTEATHFISQLPSLIHEDLLNLPAGPDTKITRETFINDLVKGFQMERSVALAVVRNFWSGLEEVSDRHILNHVLLLLPQNMREMFSGEEVKEEVVENAIYGWKFEVTEVG